MSKSTDEKLQVTQAGSRDRTGTEIAVVGMACRLPDAPDVDTFWRNLKEGVESVRLFSEEDLGSRGVSDELLASPDYVRSGVVLDNIDLFDAGFFGLSPRDAAIMDPQHRIFLECAWEALEHAGYDPGRVDAAIGVFGGCGMNAYMMYHLLSNPALMASSGEFLIRHTGNDKDFLTTRVSYELDLKGPSINVQTACSTSLVAVHLAIQSILTGESDMALAGGVTIGLDQEKGYLFQPGEILSPDGHCRSFDAESKGTIFGSGAGLVVLKRLAAAIADGDTVHAILLGSAVNNDGRGKVSYMAPSVDGQAAVIAEALAVAGVEPREISYVEAHGTGTPVGDPIEVAALTHAYRATTKDLAYCGLGSVKTNIGHLDTAAGVAGLIKVVQALKHGELPPTLHFTEPNPHLELDASPFYVVSELTPWKSQPGSVRRAGISSLGVGGTNAHVVVEEAPIALESGPSRPFQLVCVSAKTELAADRSVERLAEFVTEKLAVHPAEIAHTLHVGRKPFAHRRFAVAGLDEPLGSVLAGEGHIRGFVAPSERAPIAFMFAGGGVQYHGMGAGLYESESVYRDVVDEGLDVLNATASLDLRPHLLQGEPGQSALAMERPSIGLPALFVTQIALARQLGNWGITPEAVIGHSVGEYAAACMAGVIEFQDALRLVAFRGRLFEDLPEGGMLSVALPENELRRYLIDGQDIAAINGERMCVASGPLDSIVELESRLLGDDVDAARLRIAVAAHSSMVEPMVEPYMRFISELKLHPPQLRMASNLSGTWLKPEEAISAEHWAQHIRRTVRFADGLQTLLDEPNRLLIEVGPGRALATLARQHTRRTPEQSVITTMRHPAESAHDQRVLLEALGEIWSNGVDVDWTAFYSDEKRRRIPLPTYPFERQRYWVEPGQVVFSEFVNSTAAEPTPERKDDIADWFEVPVWTPVDRSRAADAPGRWLVIHGGDKRAASVVEALQAKVGAVETVEIGKSFSRDPDNGLQARPRELEDFRQLVQSLEDGAGLPNRVVFLDLGTQSADGKETFYAVFNFMRAIGTTDPEIALDLVLVTCDSQSVLPEDTVGRPSGALLLGPARVLPKEFPNVRTHFIDVDSASSIESVIDRICSQEEDATLVEALRAGQSYRLQYEAIQLHVNDSEGPAIKEGATYLITGGLRGIGLSLARQLATRGASRLALLGRSPASSKAARVIAALEEKGVEVLQLQADVADPLQMADALAQIHGRAGRLDGVFHAAGVLSDAPLLLKSADDIGRVLAPKVEGTQVLAEVLRRTPPDFVILFSSTSAVLGLAGQIDYAASNAFLNAFARHMTTKGPTHFVAVNWGIWRDVGMAARLSDMVWDGRLDHGSATPVEHGLLSDTELLDGGEQLFTGEIHADRQWVVDEHRLASGQALLPGTAFIDLACWTATVTEPQDRGVEVFNATFLSPLKVNDGRPATVKVLVDPQDVGYAFKVASDQEGSWVEHAVGSCAPLAGEPPILDLGSILSECTRRELIYEAEAPREQQAEFLSLGERWNCVRRVSRGENQAVATLELSESFDDDLQRFMLHPALFDMATGIGLDLVPESTPPGLFVPLVYERVRVWGRLPRKLTSCVQLKDYSESGHMARLDAQLCTADGRVLVEIEGLIMKLVPAAEVKNIGLETPKARVGGALDEVLRMGIEANEGFDAIERVLSARTLSEVVASPISLAALARAFSSDLRPEGKAGSGNDGQRNEAAKPRDEIEVELIRLWEDLLGASSVGIHDDFFDLGGHSLLAVRLFARLERTYKKTLPLATLFEAPTPAKLAELVRGEPIDAGDKNGTRTNGISTASSGEREYLVTIQAGHPEAVPFFCVHGAGGNVLNFRDLAVRIGKEQPFFGLQARGVDGRQEPHEKIEEMAEAYLREVRAAFPHGPYLLGGYSGGGVVAFEMAQQLESVGEHVGLLAFLDTFRPGIVDEDGIRGRTANLSRLIDRGPGYVVEWAKRRFEFEKWRRTRRRMDDLIRKGEPLPIEMREIHMTAAYHRAAEGYEILLLNSVGISLFTAETRAPEHERIGEDLGWRPFAKAGMEIHFVSGDHDSLMREPNVGALASKLRQSIQQVEHMTVPIGSH